ncbi:TraR/DksA family transcriptional regulator [Sinisalibacter lacisalsi]|uniref:Dimethylmenaquinone methyltransferase n=1 Tax=Sinisalibacter lacisalsi TaxID=1526570 RepID=A0ABQ1QSP8_9RHOB|nr:TraR/DksA family transcriptional regulator [Sinisalibacter lacisalsi]GGD44112.1 dimethylmenaquinone methyltransferase [Sinisalibacter lacisalsi]
MVNTEKFRGILESRRDELIERLREIDETLDSHQSKDWEELATEREGDEVLEGMGVSGKAEIAKIQAALERVQTGEYGYCVSCGDEISEERLDVVPYTPFCRDCADKRG